MSTLGKLDNLPSLSERAYGVIQDAILTLKIRPGQRVAIGDLAEQLGISRTPVRDALLLLEKEGLVTMMAQRGAHVATVTVEDVRDIYELRSVLEGYAPRLVATSLTSSELAAARAALQDAADALARCEAKRASDLGHQLHELIVRKVVNRRLISYLNDLDMHYTRIRHYTLLIPGRIEQSQEEHQRILAALDAHDPLAAEQAMEAHLMSVHNDLMQHQEIFAGEPESHAARLGRHVVLSSSFHDRALP